MFIPEQTLEAGDRLVGYLETFPVAPVEGESFVIERPSFSAQYVNATLQR